MLGTRNSLSTGAKIAIIVIGAAVLLFAMTIFVLFLAWDMGSAAL